MVSTVLIPVLIISAIGAVLAAILVIAEHFIANYGPCKININDKRQLEVQGGKDLLSMLREEKIFIPSACGGRGTCGLCKLKAIVGAGPLLPTEEPFLDEEEKATNVRLSCQVKVRNDLQIEIPAELFNIREYQCKCAEIMDLTYDTKQFRFELLEPATIDYIPGQFVQFLSPVYDKSSEEVYRAYSISSDPVEKNIIELIIRLVPGGICTTYCFEYLRVGDEVKLNGPYGEFRLTETDAPIIFVAGGSGMAPIKCLLHQMKNTNSQRTARYFFGANTVKDISHYKLMKQFEADLPGFTYIPVVSDPAEGEEWTGETGLVTEALMENVKNTTECEAYLCGSPGMITAVIKVLTELGMDEAKIFYDKFE
ncbi:MAG: 2Fe-2S iron-sulfur cluster binding domain-containing protein [Planctomycetes bacterium]|nr:2Fe-2S iron-sulfur cluster binding domain-containing protein [Planctomycetota bacterium]